MSKMLLLSLKLPHRFCTLCVMRARIHVQSMCTCVCVYVYVCACVRACVLVAMLHDEVEMGRKE